MHMLYMPNYYHYQMMTTIVAITDDLSSRSFSTDGQEEYVISNRIDHFLWLAVTLIQTISTVSYRVNCCIANK